MGEGEGKSLIGGYGRIVITGASGFIGIHMIPALVGTGCEIRCIMEPGTRDNLNGTQMHFADICTAQGIHAVLHKADAVVHLAARNHVLNETARDPLAEYRRINVEGTRNIVRAAAENGVKLFIHFSTIKAMGESSDDVLNEESTCIPMTPYGISKLESEEVVCSEADRSGMRAVIVRLPMAYGPRNKGNLTRMIRWADRGLPFPLFQPENLRSMIYVENVVAGVLTLLNRAPEGVSRYILKDSEDYSTRRIYSAICCGLGKTARFLPVPATLVRVGCMLSADLRKVTGSFRVSAAKIEKDLGFVPPISLEEGMARTVEWYRHSDH
jgi:nucleoside-diphosphate-sugar epimerase